MKKYFLVILSLFCFFLIDSNVYALDNWEGYNWAQNKPTKVEIFGYRNENGNLSFPHNTYDSMSTSAWGFSGWTTNGWGGYKYTQLSGSDYSLLQYTNSVNFHYNNYNFTSSHDYITIKGQLFPANAEGSNILSILSWYMDANYGSSTPALCDTSLQKTGNAYFINFTCSFPRTNTLILSLHFNNYTGSNQNSTFMIRSDWSDILYSNDNTNILTNSINNSSQNIINNQNSNTQNIINNQNQHANQAHQDSESIKNALTSDSIPDDTSSQANEWSKANASDSVVSDMVLMPITLLNAFYSGFNSTCQSYNLGSFYGTNLSLPCINVSNYLGSTLWGIIDVLMSGFLIFGIGKKFVKVFNDFTNLKDSQVDELYGGGSE